MGGNFRLLQISEQSPDQLQQLEAGAVDWLFRFGDDAVLGGGQTDRYEFLLCFLARNGRRAEAERGIQTAPPVAPRRSPDADAQGKIIPRREAEAVIGAFGVALGAEQKRYLLVPPVRNQRPVRGGEDVSLVLPEQCFGSRPVP